VMPKLSQKSVGECRNENFISTLYLAMAKALYLASMDDQAMTRCFFELHEIGVGPRKGI